MSAGTEQEAEERAYVYMVRCAGGQLYTGWTNDPGARLHAHIFFSTMPTSLKT